METKKLKEGVAINVITIPIVLVIEVLSNFLTTKLIMNESFSITNSLIEALPISVLLGVFLSIIFIKVKRRIDIHDKLVENTIGVNDVIWYVLDYRTRHLNSNTHFDTIREKEEVKKILEKKYNRLTVEQINTILNKFYNTP